jgi:hypothetical protein
MVEAIAALMEARTGSNATPARRYVAYYRLSTAKQALLGLGLEAQQAAVANYVAANSGKIIAEYAETKSELWRKLGDGGEEGGVTGLVIKPPEPPRWSVTP